MALLAKMAGVQAGDPNDERYWTGYAPLSLAGVSVTAESAMKISACWACVRLISHTLASIPLILYRNHADFEQTNITLAELPEGVGAFAEPIQNRMVVPIDEPSDKRFALLKHELTHIFEFEILWGSPGATR